MAMEVMLPSVIMIALFDYYHCVEILNGFVCNGMKVILW